MSQNEFTLLVFGKKSALQALLKAVPEVHVLNPITQKHSKEHILLLAKSNTHGKKFYATGGSHVCSDDFLRQRHFIVRKLT